MACPYCQSVHVYRSSSFFLRPFRILMDSDKRYCADCKKKWQSRYSLDSKPRYYRIGLLILLFLAALIGISHADRLGLFERPLSAFRTSKSVKPGGAPALSENALLKEKIKAGKLQRRAEFIEKQHRKQARG